MTINRVGLLLAVVMLGSLSWLNAGDWPQFLGPTRDGQSAETALGLPWPAKGPPRRWAVPVGAGFSGPVVTQQRVIIFHRQANQEILQCLDAVNGKELWQHRSATDFVDQFGQNNGPRATPLIVGQRVIAFGAAGRLTAVTLDSGKELWSRDTHKDYRVPQGFFGAACSPLAIGNTVVLIIGGPDAGIIAFDLATGKEVWKAANDEASYSSPVTATVDGTEHLFAFTRSGLISLDPQTGKERFRKKWRARIDASVNAATPLIVGRELFLSASYKTGAVLLSIQKDACEDIWSGDEILSCHYNTPVVVDGHLYGIEGRQERAPKLRCVEWKSGKVKWSQNRFGCADLIRAGSLILALTEEGELIAFDAMPTGYKERGRATILKRPVRAPLALAEGRVYARDDREFVCLDLRP